MAAGFVCSKTDMSADKLFVSSWEHELKVYLQRYLVQGTSRQTSSLVTRVVFNHYRGKTGQGCLLGKCICGWEIALGMGSAAHTTVVHGQF